MEATLQNERLSEPARAREAGTRGKRSGEASDCPGPRGGCPALHAPLPRGPGDARVPERALTDRDDLRVRCQRL